MANKKSRRILEDHVQRGKVFKPKFMDNLPLETIEWVDRFIPDLLWIASLVRSTSVQRAGQILQDIAASLSTQSTCKWLAGASAWADLSDSELSTIKDSIVASKYQEDIDLALLPLHSLFPDCPVCSRLCESKQEKTEKAISFVKECMIDIYDRQSHSCTLIQMLAVQMGGAGGVLNVCEGISVPSPDAVLIESDSMEYNMAAGFFRSTLSVMQMAPERRERHTWHKSFWATAFTLQGCYERTGY